MSSRAQLQQRERERPREENGDDRRIVALNESDEVKSERTMTRFGQQEAISRTVRCNGRDARKSNVGKLGFPGESGE